MLLRPAAAEDRPAVGELFWIARTVARAWMPPPVHPREEVLDFYRGLDLADGRELWVAEDAGEIVGFAELRDDWLDDLYVHPDHQRAGIGSMLLDLVKTMRPDGFGLWVFETNTPARAFYASHGLVEVELTDGSGNEERAPDVRMIWPPST
ncbi:MAG: GNAT family N-acetyltransferase [Nocardioides sp.]|uniref:GNAT family N-acetyltransferase n=1 Tax=Nocardioides sp. TaxID=35761 RepID=UPI0039E28161